MSGLPPKPEASRTSSSWPEHSDDRSYGSRPAPMAPPEHYRSRRDDRDRDRERAYHPPPRSPPPRSRSPLRGREFTHDSRNDNHRGYDSYRNEHSREKGWEPDRRASDRRDDRAWTRDEYPLRGRGRGRERGRVRGSPRRGYDNDDGYGGGRRGRDSEYDRDRDYGGRNRSRNYDRNHHNRRRFDDRSLERPGMHRPPYSPRRRGSRDRPPERHSRTRSPPSSSPRRHSRPHSPGGSTHRPSSRDPATHELHSPNPPRRQYSEHRRTQSPGLRRSKQRSLSRDIKAEVTQDEKLVLSSPAHSLRSLHDLDEKKIPPSSPRAKAEPDDEQLHVRLKVEPVPDSGYLGYSPASSSRVKEESADRDADGDFKMRDRSPVQQLHIPFRSPNHAANAPAKTPSTPISPTQSLKQTVSEETPADIPKPPTAPYLPPFPKLPSIKERLGSKYRDELSQIEAMGIIRVRTAAEFVQISKAVRRALHELDLTTMDLRAAQSRREHAENHRKKAAAGFLDIEAEFSAAP